MRIVGEDYFVFSYLENLSWANPTFIGLHKCIRRCCKRSSIPDAYGGLRSMGLSLLLAVLACCRWTAGGSKELRSSEMWGTTTYINSKDDANFGSMD